MAPRMIFFSAVFRLGASPDSNTTTPPCSRLVKWLLSLDNSLLSDETLEPTVTSAVGMQPSYLHLILESYRDLADEDLTLQMLS